LLYNGRIDLGVSQYDQKNNVQGSYGTLNMNSDGAWTYNANNCSQLSSGQIVTDSFNVGIRENSNVYTLVITITGVSNTHTTTTTTTTTTPSSNVCFPAKTPVLTNQGPVNIDDLNPAVHTIRNKKIIAITKTVAHDKNLVRIAKHALGNLYPEKTTFISQNHKVFFQGQMVKAKHLVDESNGATLVPYNGQVLYNVLLEQHEKMQVNNLIVETLHPEHKVAKLYRFLQNVDAAHHGKLIALFNKCDRAHRQSTF
jgi:VCBS repeat-containing protein